MKNIIHYVYENFISSGKNVHHRNIQKPLKIIQMKKSHLIAKILFGFIASIIVTSCISDSESPILNEKLEQSIVLSEDQINEENLRKSREFKYVERFSNQITPRVEGFNEFGPIVYLPGTGVGKATFIGKSYSFINQLVIGETTTIGAPVTQFYSDQLEELGLTLSYIPNSVNSLTTDGKGNAIFFKNDTNFAVVISSIRTEFSAKVEVVGGTGKFLGASGKGVVEGFYNQTNGKGTSTVRADIKF